jgi:predicted lipoprotein with Yx(FWY)xxD motif
MVVIDGADSGVRIKEEGTATISQVSTGRTSVAVRTDSGLVEAWPAVVQAGQTVRVRVEPPVSNADFTIEGTKLVKYTGASETPVIPWGITEVRAYAFYDSKIRSVEIPASVTVIVHSAREGASFDIPTLTTISVDQGNPAFSSRDGVLFDKAGKILYTYPRGKAEVRYSIPAGVTAIGRQAFSESQLSSVSIPAGVTAIGGWAFSESQLSSVSIPASVTAIGDYAFSGTQLSSVSIPAGVTAIGSQAFNIQTLTTISVDQGNPAFSSRDGVLFDKAGKTLHTYPRGKPEVRYSIPAGVTAIGRQAFYRTQLSSVDIPASITAIGDSAFSGTQLSSVDIPASVTAIGDHAFSGTQLSSISIPASVTAIGRLIFDIPTLTAINVDQGNPAFSSRDGVLFDKAGKTLHTYPQGKTEVRYSIPASVTAIRDHAFYRTQLSSVDIPASVTAIGDFAFSGTQLSSVSIPASVTSIGSFTFSYCENLTRVELSRGTQVTNHVFNGSPVQLYYRD